MSNDSKVFFKELTEEEKISKIYQFSRISHSHITLWKKGDVEKKKYAVESYGVNRNDKLVVDNISSDYLNIELLFTFEINGLQFFGKGKILTEKNQTVFKCADKLYKSERRANFRLLTYPHQKVYVYIPVDVEDIPSNLFQLNTGLNEETLFKNFLTLINSEDEHSKQFENCLKLRVIDISVTGVALQMGEIERNYFESTAQDFKNITLDFNGELILINKLNILYYLDFLANDKRTRLYKAGAQFLNIDTNTDEALSKIINKTLRNLDEEFEDFLK